MGLFGKDPWKDGVTTTGTIEFVTVTATDDGGEHTTAHHQYAHLTFKFVNSEGELELREQKFKLAFSSIPAPGSPVEIAYFPKSNKHLDFRQTGLPDPNEPRGWSAGVFDVPDLGQKHAHTLIGRRKIDREEELFKTGRRLTATVAACERTAWMDRGAIKWHILLQGPDGQQYETKAYAPRQCMPQQGDTIEVAVSADGKDVALDTDPRYDGPPGRALIFRTPPELAAQRVTPHEWFNQGPFDTDLDAQQFMQEALNAAGASGSGFVTFNASAPQQSYPAAPAAPPPVAMPAPAAAAAPSPDPLDRVAKLGELLKAGLITQEEFAERKAAIFNGT